MKPVGENTKIPNDQQQAVRQDKRNGLLRFGGRFGRLFRAGPVWRRLQQAGAMPPHPRDIWGPMMGKASPPRSQRTMLPLLSVRFLPILDSVRYFPFLPDRKC